MPLERVDLVEREVALAQRFNAFHDIEQPAPRFQRLVPEEQRFLPIAKHRIFRANNAILDNVNLSRIRYLAQEYIRTHPSGAARGCFQGLSLLDDVAHE